jgi:hypothetical protein
MSEEAEKLLHAIYKDRNLETLKLYIDKGYDVCALHPLTQQTLLHVAACQIVIEVEAPITEALIDRGVAVDARDLDGRTALMGCSVQQLQLFCLRVELTFTPSAIRRGLHFIILRSARMLPWCRFCWKQGQQ